MAINNTTIDGVFEKLSSHHGTVNFQEATLELF